MELVNWMEAFSMYQRGCEDGILESNSTPGNENVGTIFGMKVLRVTNEPIAAAIACKLGKDSGERNTLI